VSPQADIAQTLRVAEQVLAALQRVGGQGVIIGGMALAVHCYPRDTIDLDLATAVEPRKLDEVAAELRTLGYGVEVRKPDPDDPLGGVLDVQAEGADRVQVVNFLNPPASGFPRLVEEAVATATALIPGQPLKVVDLPHLIAFKLYAGGNKSRLDILELLDRNPSVELERLRELCRGYRMEAELDEILALAAEDDD